MTRKALIRQRSSILSNLAAGDFRYDTFEERPHLIVPVVLLLEGVHNGSGGPIYYPAEELSKLAEAWNGVPVPVFHPDNNGNPCSCNDPRIIERQNVGRMFNVHFDNGRLTGEAWIDIHKAEKVYPGLINTLKDGKTRMEVSTGLLSEHESSSGTWNGEEYETIVRNIRPDHLALLPGSRGACSWEDGCGVRNMDKKIQKYIDNVVGQREAHQKLYQFVDSLDSDLTVHFLEEVYDDYFIYRKQTRTNEISYYKVGYSIQEDGSMNVSGDPEQVKKTVSYETLSENSNKGESTMARKESKTNNECPNCVALVDGLIANEHTAWTEDHRSFLEEMDEETLKRMVPIIKAEEEEKKIATNIEKNKEGDEEDDPQPMTSNQYVENAPPEIRSVLKEGLRAYSQKKEELITKITSNERCRFTKEQLQNKDLDELEVLSELASVPNYEGNGGRVTDITDEKEEALELPVINWKKK